MRTEKPSFRKETKARIENMQDRKGAAKRATLSIVAYDLDSIFSVQLYSFYSDFLLIKVFNDFL